MVQEVGRGRGRGRANELAAIAYARDAARSGQGGLIVVTGEEGSGRTWLCEMTARQARDEGFAVGWGSGWALGEVPALWPWREALGELADPSVVQALGDGPLGEDRERFERLAGVLDALRQATAERPGVMIIDDAEAADEASLYVAQWIARHGRTLRLLVLLAFRTPLPPGPTSQLVRQLVHDGTELELRGLDRSSVAAVLEGRMAGPMAAEDLDCLMTLTGGRPAEVQWLADHAEPSVPGGELARHLVRARIAALPTAVRTLAAHGAVLDATPQLSELTRLAMGSGDEDRPRSAADAGAAVTELERLQLVRRVGAHRISFLNGMVRDELLSVLDADEVAAVHARVFALLADGAAASSRRMGRRAFHALAAAEQSQVEPAASVALAFEAAVALVADGDHDTAVRLFRQATAVHGSAGLEPLAASFLVAYAGAVLRGGHLGEARRLFELAGAAADREGDPTSAAAAALGLGGVWVAEHRSPIDRERVLDRQRRALAELPAHEGQLRRRLEVRLAAERAYVTGSLDEVEAAVDGIRATDGGTVLAEALSLYHHDLLGPRHAESRLSVAREMVSVAASSGDELASLVGLCWLTVDLFLVGDPTAPRCRRELQERAAQFPCDAISYIAEAMGVMLLAREGRFDEAERRAGECFEMGNDVGDADALAFYGAQLVFLRWSQGRSAEILPMVADTVASPTLTPRNLGFTAGMAALAADCGELDQADAALRQLTAAGLDSMPQTSAWLITMFGAAEAVRALGDRDLAAELATLLAPYADLPVMPSLAVACFGSTRRPLGLTALTVGDFESSVEHLERAVAHNERLGNRPAAALTRVDLAEARLARRERGDGERAALDLDRAIREGEAMGLTARVEAWKARRAELGDRPTSVRPASLDGSVGYLRRRGASWMLSAGDREVVVPHLTGMNHLARLLTRPGHEVAATELAASMSPTEPWAAEQLLLDEQALQDYRHRIVELEAERDEAERFADEERAARVILELDALIEELGRDTNVFGRTRAFDSSAERARTAVRKALRRALDHIEAADATLGQALRRSVQTGRVCCYRPGPGAPTRWIRQDG